MPSLFDMCLQFCIVFTSFFSLHHIWYLIIVVYYCWFSFHIVPSHIGVLIFLVAHYWLLLLLILHTYDPMVVHQFYTYMWQLIWYMYICICIAILPLCPRNNCKYFMCHQLNLWDIKLFRFQIPTQAQQIFHCLQFINSVMHPISSGSAHV